MQPQDGSKSQTRIDKCGDLSMPVSGEWHGERDLVTESDTITSHLLLL